MIELIFAGPVPERLKEKAFLTVHSSYATGWKKIAGLQSYFSFRLNNNYRILRSENGRVLVCNHDIYEKKIRLIRKGAYQ